MEKLKILLVVGARPNFMKIAPIMEAFEKFADVAEPVLLHTGQHYDHAMKALLFDQLGLPVPSIDLEVRGGTHAEQTANIMLRFEPVLDKLKPAAVLVVGDVNSTIACALVAVKKQIPVVHVEAGLRSRDLAMPEEVNRLLTDQISSRLYTTERLGNENLQSEGISADRIVFAGNVMIDTLLKNKKIAPELKEVLATNGLGKAEEVIEASQGRYIFMTLHRPSNVDSPETLRSLLECLSSISRTVPIVFAIHPRTKGNIERFGFQSLLDESAIYTAPPVGYLDSITLMSNAFVVMTDSGGIQEETTALGVPCITMRENTERWITVTEGTNTIVGVDPVKITNAFNDLLAGQGKAGRQPEFWDGHASERIVEDLICWLKKERNAKMTALSTIRNAMTVDVEDYFHVSAFEKVIDTANWNSMPRRVGYSTRRILDLFDQHNVKATFFTLGWVAERDPELVKEIASRGHEVASHGYNHGRATEMTREQFRIDVTSSKALLEDLIGQQVLGYRAPSFSINESNTWVFEVLAEAEYAYSSSTYPVKHDLYGVPHWPRFKHQLENGLTEIPLTTLRIGQRNFPISGGGFFRLYPYWLTKWLLSRFIRTESTSGIFYMHPWELDTEQPRVKDISAKSAFRHYLNIHKHEPRLEKMLKDFSWGRMDDVFEIRKSAV